MSRSISAQVSVRMIAGLLAIGVLVSACGSSASNAPGGYGNTGTPGPTAPAVAGATTVMVKTLDGQSVLVAGSNGMTLYVFAKDVANNGQSACTGGCLLTWPALTVPSGVTLSAGSGASGSLGTSAVGGSLLVTYNGLPLHFYSGDSAPGDTNGHYPDWNLVQA